MREISHVDELSQSKKKKKLKICTVLVICIRKILDVMLSIENVLSPSIRNLFSVFLKMDVGVTNGSSLLLLKMNTFHSFKKRLSENTLLPRVGRRQHQTARQLWKRNEPWKQTECRSWASAQGTGASHRGHGTEWQLRSSGSWEMAQPLLTTPLLLHSRSVCGWHCKYDPWQTQAAGIS